MTAVATDTSLATTTSNAVSVTVGAAAGGANAASFVKTDTTTQGSWRQSTLYGKQGYLIANNATSLPATQQMARPDSRRGHGPASPVTLGRCRRQTGTNRVAATYYASQSFTVDVALADGAPHQLALYLFNWMMTLLARSIVACVLSVIRGLIKSGK